MKNGFVLAVLSCVIGFFVFFGQEVLASSEKINEFSVDIAINEDSTFLVREGIKYDFGENQRHGINRDIPLKDELSLSVQGAEDETGNKYLVKTTKNGGLLNIRIGDPDKLITGEHSYDIFYLVKNGLGFFDNHDELYWNITGTEWEIPIEKSSATVRLPKKVLEQDLKFDCFTGPYGSTQKNCSFVMKENGDIYFETKGILQPKEGLTIVLGWPKGIVAVPKPLPAWIKLALEWWPILIPVFVFVFLFRKWWKDGRDPNIKKTIIAQYEPPDKLLPAEVSGIINQGVKSVDFSATIIDLAVKGYLKIKETKTGTIFKHTDYELTKLREPNGLAEYEKEILNKIFASKNSVLISDKADFYKSFEEFKKSVNEKLTKDNYFVSNPGKAIMKYTVSGIIVLIGVPFLASYLSSKVFPLIILSAIFSATLFFIFAVIMPKKTLKGVEANWYALGFKEYINTAEKYRLQFQEKENVFEKYLPYAISFGLTKKWAKAFEGIYIKPPTWYEGSFGTNFTAVAFADSLSHSISSMNAIAAPKSSGGSGFGGGGFSGGGGGGGGGGSW